MKVHQIEDNLYQGGKYPLQDKSRAEFPCNAVVTLNHGIQIHPSIKIDKHIEMPIDDGLFPGLSWLQKAVKVVEDLIEEGYKVYIHCQAGISRSAMLTAAYLMKKNFWTWDEALEFIATKNRSIDPNPRFMKGLKDWQNFLRS